MKEYTIVLEHPELGGYHATVEAHFYGPVCGVHRRVAEAGQGGVASRGSRLAFALATSQVGWGTRYYLNSTYHHAAHAQELHNVSDLVPSVSVALAQVGVDAVVVVCHQH